MKRSILALIASAAMFAQAPAGNVPVNYDDTGDAPDHAVARLSVIQGSVSVRHGDQGDLSAAVVNAPLVASDRVATAEGSRAEVQFDSSNMARLAPGTEIRMGDLQYKQYLVQIATGTVTFRVFRDGDGQVEISTPSVSIRPLRAGTYRISVSPDGTGEVTVREGELEVFGPRGSERLRPGKTMMTRGVQDPEFQEISAVPNDEWDRWNLDRDRAFQQSASSRYVSPDIYGTESLDQYGRWANDPSYGNVWVPSVSAGWAPYQQGRWVWLDYYGWTWISDDPWGWAPYHYGRWYYGSLGWSWWPGVFGSRYYWHPALVGFYGWGSGGGFGFGFGNVGWVPLAPYERYHPWYGRGYGNGYGYGGGRNLNIINNTNILNNYRNARVANGVTGVRAADFGRGGVHQGNIVRASNADLTRAGEVRGAMPFTPTQASRRISDQAVSSRGMPQTNGNTRFFSRQGAAGAGSPSAAGFAQGRQNGPVQTGSVPQNGAVQNGGFSRGNGPQNSPQISPQNPSQNGGAWRRFDPSTQARSVQAPSPAAGQVNNGGGFRGNPAASNPGGNFGAQGPGAWRRFDAGAGNGGANRGNVAPQVNAAPQGNATPQFRNYSPQSNSNAQPQINSAPRVPQSAPSYNAPNRNFSPQQAPAPSYSQPDRSYRAPQMPSYSAPQNRNFAPQRPVQINPPIVRERGGGGGAPSGGGGNYSHPQSHAGNFGGSHASGGPAPQSSGGGTRGGGGGGGHGRR